MKKQSPGPQRVLEPPVQVFPEPRMEASPREAIRVWAEALSDTRRASSDEPATETTFDASSSVLSAEERAALARFRDPRAARLYATAHVMARYALRGYRPWFGLNDPLPRTTKGKPYLQDSPNPMDGPPLYFSLSHAWPMAVVAVTEAGECGVDVEMRAAGNRWQDFAPGFLHTADLAEIRAASDPQSAFIRCWTRKEAASKAAGTGLQWDFASFRVSEGTGIVIPAEGSEFIVVRTLCCRLLHPFLDGWISVACRTSDGIMPPVIVYPFAPARPGPSRSHHIQPKDYS